MGPQAEYTDRDVEGWSIVAFTLALVLTLGSSGLAVTLLAIDTIDERDASNDAILIIAGTVAAGVIINFGLSAIGRVAISRNPNELKGRGLSKASDILCVLVLLNLIASVALVVLTREVEDTITDTDDLESTTTTTADPPGLTFEDCFSEAPEGITEEELLRLQGECAEAFPDGP